VLLGPINPSLKVLEGLSQSDRFLLPATPVIAGFRKVGNGGQPDGPVKQTPFGPLPNRQQGPSLRATPQEQRLRETLAYDVAASPENGTMVILWRKLS